MKKKISILLVLGLLQACIPSCNKKSSSNLGSGSGPGGDSTVVQTNCLLLSGVTENAAGTNLVYNLFYDTQDRLAQVTYSDGSNSTCRWLNTTTEAVVYSNGYPNPLVVDSLTFNSDGYIVSDQFWYGGERKTSTSYTYAGAELQQQVVIPIGTNLPPITITYNWLDGDLKTGVVKGPSPATYSYTYNTKLSAPGDFFQFTTLINPLSPHLQTKHQLASVSDGSKITNYTYTYDNSGKVTSISTDGVQTASMNYQCK